VSVGEGESVSGGDLQGSGFRVRGSGFRVQGSGFRVQGSGFGVQGSGFRVRGPGFRVQGSDQARGAEQLVHLLDRHLAMERQGGRSSRRQICKPHIS